MNRGPACQGTHQHDDGDDSRTIICRCEEVTKEALEKAIEQGAETLNELKRMTRAGMGLCQGRTCGALTRKLFAEKRGIPLDQVEPTTVRPPVRPVSLQALGSGVETEEFGAGSGTRRPKGWKFAIQYAKDPETRASEPLASDGKAPE